MGSNFEDMMAAARQATATGSFASQGSSSSGKPQPMVWMGTFGPGRVVDDTAGGVFRSDGGVLQGVGPRSGQVVHGTVATKKNQDDVRTVEDAYGQVYRWNDKQRKNWCDLLASKGLIDPGDYSFDSAEKWWQYAVDKSANMLAAGKKVAPQQFISRYAMGDKAGANGSGPKTTTSTSTEENVFTDPVTAQYVVRKTLEAELHRAPTEAEYRRFQDLLHRQEDEPNTSTTTTHTDGKGNTTYNTSHQDDTSPVSPEAVADQFARSGKVGKERNTTKAGIDMYAAVMKALGAGGGFA